MERLNSCNAKAALRSAEHLLWGAYEPELLPENSEKYHVAQLCAFWMNFFCNKNFNFILLHKMHVHYHLEMLGSVRFLFECFWKKKNISYAHQSCIIYPKYSKTVILWNIITI